VTPSATANVYGQTQSRRYLCEGAPGKALGAEGSGLEVLVKVERPQRSEDVRP
jgi:hypothetical protein